LATGTVSGKMKLKILLIDDDIVDRKQILRIFKASEYDPEIIEIDDGFRAVELASEEKFDIILLDYMLPKYNGIEILKMLQQKKIDTPAVVLTGQGNEETAVNIMKAGAVDYLQKDRLTAVWLIRSIENAIRVYQLDNESKQTQRKLKLLIEGTASYTGTEYFKALIESLAIAFQIERAGIAKYQREKDNFLSIFLWENGFLDKNEEFSFSPELYKKIKQNSFQILEKEENEFFSSKKYLSAEILVSSNQNEIGILFLQCNKQAFLSDYDQSLLKLFSSRVGTELERIVARKALIENETKFRAIFQNSFDAIIVFHMESIILVNTAFVKLFGYDNKDEIESHSTAIFFEDSSARSLWVKLERYYNSDGKDQDIFGAYEIEANKRDGTPMDLSVHVSAYTHNGKKYIVSIMRNITETKLHALNLAAEKERLSITIGSINDGVVTLNENQEIVLINEKAENIFEISEKYAIGKKVTEISEIYDTRTNKVVQGIIRGVIENGTPFEIEQNLLLKLKQKNKEKLVTLSVNPLYDHEKNINGAVFAIQDVTEKRKIEDELSKTTKLESISVLAGGIAHDFNNMLTAIIGNLTLTKMYMKENKKALKRLSEAEKASMMARDLTQQLLTFSKGGTPTKKTTSLPRFIKDSVEFVIRGSGVKVHYNFLNDLPKIDIDVNQMNQVINNLIINAKQAMNEQGDIFIETTVFLKDESKKIPLKNGHYIAISVRDNGPGIPAAVQQKIFEPFFTTKKTGSGLGLANCYSIIKKHNGYIEIQSEAGNGTTFILYLPVENSEAEKTLQIEEEQTKINGKIMVYDHDKSSLNTLRQMLLISGYDVSLIEEKENILSLARNFFNHETNLNVAILDISDKNDNEITSTLEEIKSVYPKVHTIATDQQVIDNFNKFGFDASLIKPFQYKELINTLNKFH
jgi:PAS domain S-box-containing protein